MRRENKTHLRCGSYMGYGGEKMVKTMKTIIYNRDEMEIVHKTRQYCCILKQPHQRRRGNE